MENKNNFQFIYLEIIEKSQIHMEHQFSSQEEFQEKISETIKTLAPDHLKLRLHREFFGSGPLDLLLEDLTISEIMVNDYNKIYFEQKGSLKEHNDCFADSTSYQNFIHRLLVEMNEKIDEWIPFANGLWRNFRVHLIQPPLASQFTLTLRRKKNQCFPLSVFTPSSILQSQIVHLMKEGQSGLIVGPTNSGKTSLLNTLLGIIPKEERLITIEDTDELLLPHSNGVKLLTKEDKGIESPLYLQDTLVKQSLRMRPDRLILGELRYKEAKDYILALSTGHRGSLATLHAQSPHQALLRLETLIQMGAPEWSLQTIRRLIWESLDFIITLQSRKKQILGLHKIISLEDFGFITEPVYEEKA